MAHVRAESKPRQTSPTPTSHPLIGRQLSSDDSPSLWRVLRNNPLLLYTMILNPVLVLHFINGLLSLLYPDDLQYAALNTSVQPHLDVHANDGFCRLFTVIMVALQSAVYSSRAPKVVFPLSMRADSSDEDLKT